VDTCVLGGFTSEWIPFSFAWFDRTWTSNNIKGFVVDNIETFEVATELVVQQNMLSTISEDPAVQIRELYSQVLEMCTKKCLLNVDCFVGWAYYKKWKGGPPQLGLDPHIARAIQTNRAVSWGRIF